MNQADFEQELAQLQRDFKIEQANTGCLSSTNLRGCSHCMFSDDLENCFSCTHSTSSSNCSHMSHSTGCDGCHSSAYLTQCTSVIDSNYMVLSESCSGCNYCFGCIGLVKKDFHILNQRYARKEYFEIVNKLKKEMRIG